jgi:hypothetical protein
MAAQVCNGRTEKEAAGAWMFPGRIETGGMENRGA